MSELKYYKLIGRAFALTSSEFISSCEFGHSEEVYLKSEADKVIEELEGEKESLLQQNRELCQALHEMYSKEEYDKLKADNVHQKYKRCLDKAKLCELDMEQWIEGSLRWQRRKNWLKRWMGLAEKFKEVK